MKPYIIPIFINNEGCPNRCVFCNERITAGDYSGDITRDTFRKRVDALLPRPDDPRPVEIAFYGGNFTGIPPHRQEELLCYAADYMGWGIINTIRISTRPDYIDEKTVERLVRFGVSTVELGAQSMDDAVLSKARRGHSARDTTAAVNLLKKYSLITGIHLMAGLPGDTEEGFYASVDAVIRLAPDTVRIHPTIILRDTPLADLYQRGMYTPLTMEQATTLCMEALRRFHRAYIPVIRLGLQITGEMEREGNIVAGPFHPSFGFIVMSTLFRETAAALLSLGSAGKTEALFSLHARDVSAFRGLRNGNISALKERFPLSRITVRENLTQKRHTVALIGADGGIESNIFAYHMTERT